VKTASGAASGPRTPLVWLATPGDAATVVRLLAEFRDWNGRERPPEDELLAGIQRLMRDPDTEYLLGAVEGLDGSGAPEAAGRGADGVCQLRFRYGVWESAEDCWLEDLFVRERARRTGLGVALVEAAVERALRRGCRRIDLDASSDNEAALALYRGFGFSAETPRGSLRLMLRRPLEPPSS
jgi:GNAT superfamily N-acetyltransferase